MEEAREKIKRLDEVSLITQGFKKRGKKVVTTNGCFDILHIGHVRNLQRAKSLGDILIVGVNADKSVRENKGKSRPIIPERERAEVVAALKSVDYVFIFKDKTPNEWLKKIRPDLHVKGADRRLSQIVELETLREIGAKLVRVPLVKGKSTSSVVNKIRNL